MTNSEKLAKAFDAAQAREEAEKRRHNRESFYEGAQYLYDVHFTSVHPFPAREVMNQAMKLWPEPQTLRTVRILGVEYRANGEVLEVFTGGAWSKAVAITPGFIRTLNELLDNPYEVAK